MLLGEFEEDVMSHSTSTLTIAVIAALTLGAAAAHAQTKAAPKCGVETWSTDQMAYVVSPCAGDTDQTVGQTATAPGTAKVDPNCGPETWSTDQMAYVPHESCKASKSGKPAGATK